MTCIKNPFMSLALLTAIPGAYLSFKRSFIKELKEQIYDLDGSETGLGMGKVTFSYKCIARLFIGWKLNWIDLFNQNSETYKKLSKDKSISLRILIWFMFTFIFSFLAWLFS